MNNRSFLAHGSGTLTGSAISRQQNILYHPMVGSRRAGQPRNSEREREVKPFL